MAPGGWKLHTGIHTHPHTLELWPRQFSSERPRSTVTPSLSFPRGRKTHSHVRLFFYFSLLSPPFLFFSKESQPLALTLSLYSLPSLSLVGMEADGSWHDGGIVLTVELMWPRGSCPCALGLMAQNAKRFVVERGWEKLKGVRAKQGENSRAWR